MEISKEFRFEASHILPKHPGRCSRLHGHSWVFKISVKGEVDPETGFVMDFYDISTVGNKIANLLDHRHLGAWNTEFLPRISAWAVDLDYIHTNFYPTSENLLLWMASFLNDFPWSKLELNETCTSAAILTREEYEGSKL